MLGQTFGCGERTVPIDPVSAMTAIKSAIDMFRGGIALAKEANALSSTDSSTKEAASKSLEAAERAVQLAEAEMAKTLGYRLCQCTFPPQIMLSEGREPKFGEEVFRCGQCKNQYPPKKHFQELQDYEDYKARENSFID